MPTRKLTLEFNCCTQWIQRVLQWNPACIIWNSQESRLKIFAVESIAFSSCSYEIYNALKVVVCQGRQKGFGQCYYFFLPAGRTSFALRAPTAPCVLLVLNIHFLTTISSFLFFSSSFSFFFSFSPFSSSSFSFFLFQSASQHNPVGQCQNGGLSKLGPTVKMGTD